VSIAGASCGRPPGSAAAIIARVSSDADRVRKSLSAGVSVRTPKAAEQIARHLRGLIVRGETAPGTMLSSEKALLDEFGVSRPTLREAFRILENEGLIVVLTGARGGARVQLPDLGVVSRQIGYYLQAQQTTLRDLLEARAEFEPICARLLAERRSDDTLRELDELVASLIADAEKGFATGAEYAAWVHSTRALHELIAEGCGNNTLAAQARSLSEMLGAHRRVSLRSVDYRPGSPETIAEIVADYARLAENVRSGDGGAAESLWREHLRRSTEIVFRAQDPDTVVNLLD